MFPLVGIATAILPDLIRVLAGDKGGTIAADVVKAVQTASGTSDPAAAKQKLAQDPQAAADLQEKLAQIAIDATKAQNAEQDKLRQDQIAQMKEDIQASLQNTGGARSTLLELVKDQSSIGAWPGWISLIVTIGFFIFVAVILWMADQPLAANQKSVSDNNLVNITIGALVAAFSTVVNFWLGSSLGSHNKDAANAQMQAAETASDIQVQEIQQRDASAAAATAAAKQQSGAQAPVAAQKPLAPPQDNFNACVAITLLEEGGYCVDDGGPTNFGITHATLANWRGVQECSADEVKALTKHDAGEIYRAKYWIPTRCADLPKGVDLVVFDFAVNSGPVVALKHLQQVLGVKDDSSIGPITLAALKAMEPKDLINRLAADRLQFLQGLGDKWRLYKDGWTKRVEEVRQDALKMAG